MKLIARQRQRVLDVGFPFGEAENLQLRAQLMSQVRDAVRGMRQREAAKRFGVTQPRLNDLTVNVHPDASGIPQSV